MYVAEVSWASIDWATRWSADSLERSVGGALDLAALPVPGLPTVPPLRVPLSHTLLAIGFGLRR